MKAFAKILLAGTVAVMAVAMFSAPSEAAKKKSAKAGCVVWQSCQRADGVKMICDGNGNWTPTLGLPCLDKSCGPPC